MSLRPALLLALPLSLMLSLAACNKADNTSAPAADATTTAADTTTPANPENPSSPAAETPMPEATPEPTPAATAEVPVGPAPVAGIDYADIAGGQQFEPTADKIEVVEVFSYTCPHCAEFEPMLLAWRGRQTADVKFTPVAGPFGGNPEPFVKAFYAAQSLGLLAKTHEALFRAIHIDHSLNAMGADNEKVAAFYGKFGADPKVFLSTMTSFAVDAKAKRAIQYIQAAGVEGTPSLVINGKYRVTGKTMEDTLRIATHLIAKERAAQGGAAPAAGG
ncbi:thiol:disulfide interchange protein DsbA/DsbL [Lysobacter fragariae]